jgi:hypothetical protein
MIRFYNRLVGYTVIAIAFTILSATWCGALSILSPADGQIVRENVKIQLPANAIDTDSYITLHVGEQNQEVFIAAVSRDAAKEVNGVLTFYWNSKAPYYDPDSKEPTKEQYFKDGKYSLKVVVHDVEGKTLSSAATNINIKNRVDRPNPAPAVRLVNRMSFGQTNTYNVHADVSVFELINKTELPIIGGMSLGANATIVQSVEDVRQSGEYLLRCRMDENAYVNSRGYKTYLFAGQPLKPQLYRLVNKLGKTVEANMFAKQAKYSITDILPVLPQNPVKEGDSWPDSINLKVEGLTPVVKLKGTSHLDSFEWQNGHECVKIVSTLKGQMPLSLANGKIQGGGSVDATVTTFFAFRSGRMLRREIALITDATILPGAGDDTQDMGAPTGPDNPYAYATSPFSDEDESDAPVVSQRRPGVSSASSGMLPNASIANNDPSNLNKKGRVHFDIVIKLEK